MSNLTKRKKQLLSIVLCFCMIMTGITMEKKEAKAETYYVGDLKPHEGKEYKPYYEYVSGNIVKNVFTSDDLIQYNENKPLTNLYKEGEEIAPSEKLPEGEWIISNVNDSGGYSVSIVSATAETQVYLETNSGNFVQAAVGEAGEDGMAPVTFPTEEGDEDTLVQHCINN